MPNKISVIVPIYNVEKYIEQCLMSLCNQSLKDIEIICVDDCGSDDSMNIVQKYAKNDSRIKIVKHPQNKGLGAARNSGMQVATGEYLGFVDSDDYVDKDFYKKLYETASETKADIVQSYVKLFYEDNEKFKNYELNSEIKNFDSRNQQLNNLDIYYNSGMCWNKIYKTSLIKEHNIQFPEGVYWEDNPFVIRAAYYANAIVPVPETYYIYRQRSGSIVKLANKKLHFDLLKTHNEMVKFLNSIPLKEKEYLFIFNRFIERISYEYEKILNNEKLYDERKIFTKESNLIIEQCKYLKAYKKQYKSWKKVKYKYFEKQRIKIKAFLKWIFEPISISISVLKIITKILKNSHKLIILSNSSLILFNSSSVVASYLTVK